MSISIQWKAKGKPESMKVKTAQFTGKILGIDFSDAKVVMFIR